jgi:hypothetical protein
LDFYGFNRKLRLFMRLCLMDTDNPLNFLLVNDLMREAAEAGFKEAFLESAPQESIL